MVSRSQRAIRRDKWVSDLGAATQNHNFTDAHLIPDDDADDGNDDGNDDEDNNHKHILASNLFLLWNLMFLVLFKIDGSLFGREMTREKFSFHKKPG